MLHQMAAPERVSELARAFSGFGGHGAVNCPLLANAALSCAPAGASLEVIAAAIGRGVGRSAAHELAHLLLPSAPIYDSKDAESYEYASAGRCQRYHGPMHWNIAGPWLASGSGRDGRLLQAEPGVRRTTPMLAAPDDE
ncbi:MAG: hypothetical protein KA371_18485 [Acidobacteria bacterium]|nr:hypothetical protein [Acidobacteriota bacterium]